MFRNDKFPGFGYPYNLFAYFQNKDIVIQIKLCRNANGFVNEELFFNKGSNKL